MGDFTEDFANRSPKNKKDPETRFTVKRDRWDRRIASKMEREMKEFVLASKDLQQITDTGLEAMLDTFSATFKVIPHLKDGKEVRPSYLVNHKVMNELVQLNEYEELHGANCGDAIASALATCAMEPELERLFQRLDEENKQAQDLEQMLQQQEGLEGDAEDIADQLQEAMAAGGEGSQEAKNFQENLDALQEQIDALQEQINQGTEELENSLDDKAEMIANGLAQAVDDAQEQQDSLASAETWGLQPGGKYKTDPSARMELAKRLNTERFRLMSEMFGRMQNIAFSAQLERSEYIPEEIYDITQGNSLEHILPIELAFTDDDTMALDFLRRYFENSLLQYDLRGHEELNKGGIILCEDGSSSMGGSRTIWAKAIGLALLKVASMQHRGFHALHFGGPGQMVEFDFDTSGDIVSMKRDHSEQELYGVEAVLDFAETMLNGGTDFMTPLGRALDIIRAQFDAKGSTDADIVFLTDGYCGVPPDFLSDFAAEQERIGFNVYGIAIETDPNSEPLKTICDGKVTDLSALNESDPRSLSELFGSL